MAADTKAARRATREPGKAVRMFVPEWENPVEDIEYWMNQSRTQDPGSRNRSWTGRAGSFVDTVIEHGWDSLFRGPQYRQRATWILQPHVFLYAIKLPTIIARFSRLGRDRRKMIRYSTTVMAYSEVVPGYFGFPNTRYKTDVHHSIQDRYPITRYKTDIPSLDTRQISHHSNKTDGQGNAAVFVVVGMLNG
ncbi:hypothetical protein K504DRAFT_506809 [Pleomassaria siparia CBS 279.74]|uniref:Uncharacterized protein n=1 Tax=Pleomassaria siparia CBS 279.74 TaxID=1314801 RepID=A0A6G1JW60_9PLEO|nr:hypothetical protein K504DRAFT_506809 [Pleomassaria siparia CBS 279.74]